jgi:hypothetical protein
MTTRPSTPLVYTGTPLRFESDHPPGSAATVPFREDGSRPIGGRTPLRVVATPATLTQPERCR